MTTGGIVPLLQAETGGLLTTVQDGGRAGQQRSGLTPSGAMDPFAASVANLLLGNPRRAAVLEITLLGPALRVMAQTQIALCGADLSAQVDGAALPLWKTVPVQPGQRLSFGRRRSGARVYLAVSGGFAVPEVLGSRSTFLRGQMGGLAGRALRPGDTLLGDFLFGDFLFGDLLPGSPLAGLAAGRGLPRSQQPDYSLPAVLRVLPGPHFAQFADAALDVFFAAAYAVSPQSDRQGYRLTGPAVTRSAWKDVLSEPMPLGGLQVPPDGQPILLMADRQTTGGYPLLGVVASADIPRAAQLAPGDPVRFAPVSLAEAATAAIEQERRLRLWEIVTGSL